MGTKVTTETFNEMQKIFIKVTDENLSYQELEAALLPYNKLPLLCKYFHSKYYYRQPWLQVLEWAERPDALLQIPGWTSNLEIYLPDFYLELVPFWNIFNFMERKVSL